MKRKGILAIVFALALVIAGVDNGAVPVATAETDNVAAVAIIKSATDLRNYIDNENAFSCQDVIATDWSGDTPVYQVEIPSDGTLYICCLSRNGYAEGCLYSNFALTSEVGKVNGTDSDREQITSLDVKQGTYYYRASRWNGTEELTVTTFMGFAPKDTTGVIYADTSAKYDKTDNVELVSLDSKDALADYINRDGVCCSQDTIETDWKGYSDVHSFTVEESGWLIAYPLCENEYINLEIYSDANLISRLLKGGTISGTTEEPYSCYLTPGTYYYRGSRWNGTDALTFSTYLGFLKDSSRFSVVSNTNSADKTSATVTFQAQNGLIRVVKGEYDPSNIQSDDFWKTENRENALEGVTATIKENGDYVARLETEDGCHVMVPFTVSGLIELPSPAPTAAATPTPTPTAKPILNVPPTTTRKPVVTPTVTNYKVTVAKKTVTVKKKKTVKVKYSVTAGYTGTVKFTSSNKKIATVSSKGVVTGKKKGKCKITVKLSNGNKAVVTVKVK